MNSGVPNPWYSKLQPSKEGTVVGAAWDIKRGYMKLVVRNGKVVHEQYNEDDRTKSTDSRVSEKRV